MSRGADGHDGPKAAVSPPMQVSVKTVRDEVLIGQLAALSVSEGVLIRLPDGPERQIPLEDVVCVDTAARPLPRRERDWTVRLASGDYLYGRIIKSHNDYLEMEAVDLGILTLPLDSIRQVDTPQAAQPAYRPSVQWVGARLDSSPPKAPAGGQGGDDAVLLINGDVLYGFITAISAEGATIDGAFGEASIPAQRIVSMRMAAPTPPQAADRLRSAVTFRSSGRLTLSDLTWTGRVAGARLPEGKPISFEAERIVNVEVVGGRWEWLSSHRPISHEHTPMLSLAWDYAVDRNVLGGPMRVAGEVFERGFGVHSRSGLIFELKGKYRTLVTDFGIDDDSGPHADVTIRILVDGKVLFDQKHVRRGKRHGPIRLDVTGAKRVELIVDFGENGDVQDRFDWIEPALIR